MIKERDIDLKSTDGRNLYRLFMLMGPVSGHLGLPASIPGYRSGGLLPEASQPVSPGAPAIWKD